MEKDFNVKIRGFFGESQAIQEHMSVAVVRMENVAGEYEGLSASMGKFMEDTDDLPTEIKVGLRISIRDIDRMRRKCLEAADLEQSAVDIEEGLFHLSATEDDLPF